MKKIILSIALITASSISSAQIRHTHLRPDEILTVRTAIGIATIIQLPEPIHSAIIGDQSGFKVEHLDKAVTVKPLRWNVTTNLYLVTDKRRYNLRLVTLKQSQSDFIVYIKEPSVVETVKWSRLNKTIAAKSGVLHITRVGQSRQGFILIEARFTPNRETSIKPDDIWIKQKNEPKVINGLYLSETKAAKKKPILIGISLAKSDLEKSQPVVFEIKSKASVTIQESALWR